MEAKANPTVHKRRVRPVHELKGWRRWLLLPASLTVRAWMRSVRIVNEAEVRALVEPVSGGLVFALWHNRNFASARAHRLCRGKGKRLHAMISTSRDGAWLTAFYHQIGVHTVRGSTTHRGGRAALEMVELLRQGHDVGITVDGPRGPIYTAQEGAALIAQRAEVPILAVAPIYHGAWRANSWDRYFVPRPFSSVEIRARLISPGGTREALTDQVTVVLRELSRGSDAIFGL